MLCCACVYTVCTVCTVYTVIFRTFQIECLRALLDGNHLLANVLMGAGKTTIIPAYPLLLKELGITDSMGITLVVVPVIALAEQHIKKLRAQGFTACRVGDPNDPDALKKILHAEVQFGYLSPEVLIDNMTMLVTAKYRKLLRNVVFDECHYIIDWGLGKELPGELGEKVEGEKEGQGGKKVGKDEEEAKGGKGHRGF